MKGVRLSISSLWIMMGMVLMCASTLFAQTIEFGKYHALLIANQNYKHWNILTTPHNDVDRLAAILERRYGFEAEILYDATRDQIIDKLEEYKTRLTSNDNLLIYYAGHGKLRKDGGYWIGVDGQKLSRSKWLHFSTINELIDSDNGMNARHILVIADSCYAGALTRDEDEDLLSKKQPGESERAWYSRIHTETGRLALTSGGTEPVLDHTGTAENSIFAKEILRRLKSNYKILEAGTLYDQIKMDVYNRASRIAGSDAQKPEFAPIKGTGDSGGSFLFVLKGTVVERPDLSVVEETDFGVKGDDVKTYDVEGSLDSSESIDIPVESSKGKPIVSSWGAPEQIHLAQKRLHQIGLYPGAVDGKIGPRTSSALMRFQKMKGLLITGNLDRSTWEALANLDVKQPHPRTVENKFGMEFVFIPPGTFTMGSPESEPGRRDNERQHQVTLTKGFYMQTTEVTQGQWQAVMRSNSFKFQSCGESCPVENVSWYDVQKFIAKLKAKAGIETYRLPTEAEWEYAARAGSETAYYTGDTEADLDRAGWCGQNSNGQSHPVAQKEANQFGLYDMHGNVWEWCKDFYTGHLGSNAVNDPQGPSDGWDRVVRGGSWIKGPAYCRAASRVRFGPRDRHHFLGFRLVLIPGQGERPSKTGLSGAWQPGSRSRGGSWRSRPVAVGGGMAAIAERSKVLLL
jgi:formylglycine-generating enzyme required for sulfatase activity/uncharacterized caspase-like protein